MPERIDPASTLPEIPGYLLANLLGCGASGALYEARELVTRRDVAVKWLPFAASEAARRRFEHEAQAAAAVRHPNVARVFRAGQTDRGRYLVMELVRGVSLANAIETNTLGTRLLVDVVARTARGLEAEHSAGVVHRDVKPANILIDERGEPRLVDLGVARPELAGTLAYAAPEVAEGGSERATAASDVFSLGCVLYEGLSARLPFGEGADRVARIGNLDPLPDTVPAELASICAASLDPDPAKRLRAGDLASRLEAFAARGRKRPTIGPRVMALALLVAAAGTSIALLVHVADRLLVRTPAHPAGE